VKRLVQTSNGWVEIELTQLGSMGMTATIAVFGDGGWARVERHWNRSMASDWNADPRTLPELLAELASIPQEEATTIVDATVSEWRSRGGNLEDRSEKRKLFATLASVATLAVIGAVAIAAALAWLLLRVA
jgi:hypothetical protein